MPNPVFREFLGAGILAVALALPPLSAQASAANRALPAPAFDPPPAAARETALLAGGCFWGCRRCSSTPKA